MCRLQFYRNIQKKSTNPSIRTLVSTLQCRFLCVFRILPYTHSAKLPAFFDVKSKAPDVKSKAPDVKSKALYITVMKRTGFACFLLLRQSRRREQIAGNASVSFSRGYFPPGKNGGLSTSLSTFAHFVSPAALCGKIPRARPGRVCLSRRRLPLRRMNQHINTGGIHGFNSLADKLTAAFPHAEDNGARPSAAICRAVSATRRKACRGGPERLHRVLF